MKTRPDAGFQLDARLAADTLFVAEWNLCRVLLMDDAQFPWLVLVPRREGLVELDDLAERERTQLMRETAHAMKALRGVVECDKFNVGALGNIVRQLHVHVVARREGDAAWPGPVWGHGPAHHYLPEARDKLLDALRRESGPEDVARTRRRQRDG
jgi:diadenosine tetraphosphate (Ap4A) HIT family hydrolase